MISVDIHALLKAPEPTGKCVPVVVFQWSSSGIVFSSEVSALARRLSLKVREVTWPTVHYPQYSAKLFLRMCQIRYNLFPRNLLGCTRVTALDVRVPSFTPTEDAKARFKTTWFKSSNIFCCWFYIYTKIFDDLNQVNRIYIYNTNKK